MKVKAVNPVRAKVQVHENNITTSKNFESKIASIINGKILEYGEPEVEEITLVSVGMSWEGRGQYKEIMELVIDENEYYIVQHSTDSQTYDTIGDSDINPVTYNNFMKRFALSLLENKVDRLVNDIFEKRDLEEHELENEK